MKTIAETAYLHNIAIDIREHAESLMEYARQHPIFEDEDRRVVAEYKKTILEQLKKIPKCICCKTTGRNLFINTPMDVIPTSSGIYIRIYHPFNHHDFNEDPEYARPRNFCNSMAYLVNSITEYVEILGELAYLAENGVVLDD